MKPVANVPNTNWYVVVHAREIGVQHDSILSQHDHDKLTYWILYTW